MLIINEYDTRYNYTVITNNGYSILPMHARAVVHVPRLCQVSITAHRGHCAVDCLAMTELGTVDTQIPLWVLKMMPVFGPIFHTRFSYTRSSRVLLELGHN